MCVCISCVGGSLRYRNYKHTPLLRYSNISVGVAQECVANHYMVARFDPRLRLEFSLAVEVHGGPENKTGHHDRFYIDSLYGCCSYWSLTKDVQIPCDQRKGSRSANKVALSVILPRPTSWSGLGVPL